MADVVLQVKKRDEHGKNANRRLRAAGRIPIVVYGRDRDSVSLSVDPADLVRILQSETGQNTIFKVKLGSKTADVLVRDYQLDPLRGALLHADLQTVAMDRVMTFEVPFDVVGEAPGVKAGGIIDMVMRSLEVECLPGDVPENIPVDISELEIGDALRIGELEIEETTFKVLSDPDQVAVTVAAPKVEEEEEEEVEEVLEGEEEEGVEAEAAEAEEEGAAEGEEPAESE